MSYKEVERTGSARVHLTNILKENEIFSEFPKEGFFQLIDQAGYYFSEELVEKDFNFDLCVKGKTSGEFMELTGYSRPKINTYLEKYGKIFYITEGYYDIGELRKFIVSNIKKFIEKRGRPRK